MYSRIITQNRIITQSRIITQIMDDVEHTIRIKVRKHVAYHNFMEVYTLKHIDQLLDCEFHIREQFMDDVENES